MSRRHARSFSRFVASAALAATAFFAGCDNDPGECQPGSDSCACASPDRCDDGLVCNDGMCRAPRLVGLDVPTGAAACEVLLVDAASEVAGVRFADGVLGSHVREEPRTSISFAASGEGALPSRALSLEVLGEGEAGSIDRASCVDASGRVLTDTVRIGS